MIAVLLLAIQVSTSQPNRPGLSADTIVVVRKLAESPRRVSMQKDRTLTRGSFFSLILSRLQQNGYFELSAQVVAAACGNPGVNANRLFIRVHDATGWRELIIPDACQPASPALNGQLAALRKVAWDGLAGPVRNRKLEF